MSIASALQAIQERISQAAASAGRDPASVTLIAVSKTFPAEAVLEAVAAGQRHFGENRVEEALPKLAVVAAAHPAPDLHWHLIGHLQSRKAKDAVGRFSRIHSVDSLKLAETLSRRAASEDSIDMLLECNVSGEASKEGFDLSGWEQDTAKLNQFSAQIAAILALTNARVRGLMTMAPIVDDANAARPVFASLRHLRDALLERLPPHPSASWNELSMGMSGDFEAAIAEGSTHVRIGRAIFGAR